mmetsp:Transcript_19888/g.44146  ORF Transcript_19888/g.44146 Transcript_19888/m.44146 type:complete len:453 (-) Transcript_19888:425-1783(-)
MTSTLEAHRTPAGHSFMLHSTMFNRALLVGVGHRPDPVAGRWILRLRVSRPPLPVPTNRQAREQPVQGPQSPSSQSLSHPWTLQDWDCWISEHGRPPFWDCIKTGRTRVFSPPPHSLEHPPQPLQSPSWQSTGHGLSLHFWRTCSGGHADPCFPASCTWGRLNSMRPPVPQVLEHSPGDQGPTSQSITTGSEPVTLVRICPRTTFKLQIIMLLSFTWLSHWWLKSFSSFVTSLYSRSLSPKVCCTAFTCPVESARSSWAWFNSALVCWISEVFACLNDSHSCWFFTIWAVISSTCISSSPCMPSTRSTSSRQETEALRMHLLRILLRGPAPLAPRTGVLAPPRLPPPAGSAQRRRRWAERLASRATEARVLPSSSSSSAPLAVRITRVLTWPTCSTWVVLLASSQMCKKDAFFSFRHWPTSFAISSAPCCCSFVRWSLSLLLPSSCLQSFWD